MFSPMRVMQNFSMRKGLLISSLFILGLAGCTKSCYQSQADLTPADVVEAYIELAFNMTDVSERTELVKYTTGNLKDAIESVNDEKIKEAYVDRQYRLHSYSLIERLDRTPRETEITFQITYQDLSQSPDGDEANTATISTENTVSVKRESSLWLISDVLGKRTSIEFPVIKDMEIKASAP